jgi:hypothetical protein
MPSLNKCIGPPSTGLTSFCHVTSTSTIRQSISINQHHNSVVRLADRRLDPYNRAFLQRLSANESMQSCGVHYGVNATMRLFHRRSRGGNQDSDDGRRPRAYRSMNPTGLRALDRFRSDARACDIQPAPPGPNTERFSTGESDGICQPPEGNFRVCSLTEVDVWLGL